MREDRGEVWVRSYEPERDKEAAETLERICEVDGNGSGKPSLFTDLLGDPIGRVRNSPSYIMLVAEMGGAGEAVEMVGLIRGCVKTVSRGNGAATNGKTPTPVYAKVGYVLGLRVSPYHRRKGIGMKLVKRLELWFREMEVEYSYMATDKSNEASVRLFTDRCEYSKFRTPSLLVHPVFAHPLRSPSCAVTKLSASDAELLYRSRFSSTEFFPRDIDVVLRNPLCLGTYLATSPSYSFPGVKAFLDEPPESWAVASVWNLKDVFRLEVRGVPVLKRAMAKATRAVDRAFPWLRIPSVPDLFRPFGVYFLFGVGGGGTRAAAMATALFACAHEMAREGGCGVVATEVGCCDPLRAGIPRWEALSCDDLWCIKKIGIDDPTAEDWTKSLPGPSIFVDPREL